MTREADVREWMTGDGMTDADIEAAEAAGWAMPDSDGKGALITLARELRACREVLRRVEWTGGYDQDVCPICGASDSAIDAVAVTTAMKVRDDAMAQFQARWDPVALEIVRWEWTPETEAIRKAVDDAYAAAVRAATRPGVHAPGCALKARIP